MIITATQQISVEVATNSAAEAVRLFQEMRPFFRIQSVGDHEYAGKCDGCQTPLFDDDYVSFEDANLCGNCASGAMDM